MSVASKARRIYRVRAGEDARHAAQHSTTAMEKKEDSRVMIEQSNLAFAQSRRAERALTQLKALDTLLETQTCVFE